MATDVSDRIRELALYQETSESAIIQQAIEAGIETLWRDMIISKYLNDDITRDEGCEEVGVDVINRIDQAQDAIHNDIRWGLDDLRA